MRPLPLLIILLVLDHVAFNGGRIAVSLTAISQGASPLTVGLLMASFALLPALLAVPAGRWIDGIGVQRPMMVGSVGVGIGTLLPFLLPQIAALYVASVLIGISFMLINVAAYHAVGELSSAEDRTANFSYVALGFSTSSFIAPLLTGVSIDQLGHRFSFLVLALFTVMPAVVLALVGLPDTRRRPAAPVEGASGEKPRMFDLLRSAEMRNLFIAIGVLTVAWDIYTFAMPLYGTQIGLSASQIGIVMGSFAAASFMVRLAMPFVASRVRPWQLITVSMLLAAASYAAIPFSHSVGTLMAIMFVLGASLGAPHPMVLTLLHHSAPAGRAGEAVGLRTMFINTSQTAMPLVFGVLGAALGLAPLFLAMTAALLGGGVLARRVAQAEHIDR